MRKLIFFILIFMLMIMPVSGITITSLNNSYLTVERTGSLFISFTSDNSSALSHWILDGTNLGTNVTNQTIVFTQEHSVNLTVYQTFGAVTSNILHYTIIVRPYFDNSSLTQLNTTLLTNMSNAIQNSSLTETLTVSRDYYVNSMGLLFYVFIWGIYAGMLYIRQNTWHIPALLAVILSSVILSQVPDAYRGIVQIGTIAGVFAVLYSFFKSKR